MPYNNLIYFLVVILILATNSPADSPQFSGIATISFFVLKLCLFRFFLHRIFTAKKVNTAVKFAKAERQSSIMAIIFLALDVYALDCQFYFAQMPLARDLPVIVSFCGVLLFLFYLTVFWSANKSSYQEIYLRKHTTSSFIITNLKTNLPIILPWFILSLLIDILRIVPVPAIHQVLDSQWGEPVILSGFFVLMLLTFPAMMTKVWDCLPMPPSPLRSRIESFCTIHKVACREIMIWPLFEGHALTAGVMGFIQRFRYLLITPALIKALTPEELEAVIAHEIGHIKKRHLQLYLLIFLSFGIMTQLFTEPIYYLVANSDLFYKMVEMTGKDPEDALALASTLPIFILMVIYFRYVMGYFMRNFERQADLYALKAINSCTPLINVFEKISWLSGNIHDLPSWHHFSINQRINFLRKSSAQPELIDKHNQKVSRSLAVLVLFFSCGAFFLFSQPNNLLKESSNEKYTEALIITKIKEQPKNYALFKVLGDFRYSNKKFAGAIDSYQKSLTLAPNNSEVLNNLAWLLLTAEDDKLQNHKKGLALAERAAELSPASPHILDTLALAFWLNNLPDKAISTARKALMLNREPTDYYQKQLDNYLKN